MYKLVKKNFLLFLLVLPLFSDYSFYIPTLGDLRIYYITSIVFFIFRPFIFLNKKLAIFLFVSLFCFVISSLILDTSIVLFLKQLIMISLFFYIFDGNIRKYGVSNNDLPLFVDMYIRVGFYISILSVFLFLVNDTGRLCGLYGEPAAYAQGMSPVVFYYFNEYAKRKSLKSFINFITVLLPYVLTVSSVGFMLILFMIFFIFGLKKIIKIFILVSLVFFVVYFNVDMVKIRVDDMLYILSNFFDSTSIGNYYALNPNFTVYAIQSNLFVALNSFLSNPLSGIGLGNHQLAFDFYYNDIPGVNVISGYGLEKLNYKDAASMFSRLISELGIIGLFFIIYLFNLRAVSEREKFVKNLFLVILLGKLLRSGNYLTPDFIPFLACYLYFLGNKEIKYEKSKL
ncbi:TPA: hypothetical protein ACX6QT_003813 [Photobacterium damselae]